MTRFLIISIALFFSFSLSAQNIVCGYDLAVESMEKKHPGYKQVIQSVFKEAKLNAQQNKSFQDVYEIPVVFHVVWNEEVENIDEELINTQLEILNEDFRRLNEDADSIRSIFADVVGDPMIEFRLEEIRTVQTSATFEVDFFTGGLPDIVKQSNEGGSDPKDTEAFLNIWICKIQPILFGGQVAGQVLGYAYPPDSLDNWPPDFTAPSKDLEGVVLDYRVVGKNNPFSVDPGTGEELNFLKGRSAVHEVGHYLGLRHIWGDGSPFAKNSCDEDDGVEDTPNAGSQSVFNCDTLQNTCSSTVDDLPDMIENFMDYSNETCQNSFTNGQIQIMRSVLENQRCKLVGLCEDVSTKQIESYILDISPNPSSQLFYISSKEINIDNFSFQVFNINGQIININIENGMIDLHNSPSGIYLLRGEYDNKIIQEKLIKI